MDAPGKSVRNVRKGNRLAFTVSLRLYASLAPSVHPCTSWRACRPLQMATQTAYCHIPLSLLLLLSLDSRDIPACREQGAGESGWRREKRWISVHYATTMGTRPDTSESKEHEEQETECATLTGKEDSTQLQGWNKGVFLFLIF